MLQRHATKDRVPVVESFPLVHAEGIKAGKPDGLLSAVEREELPAQARLVAAIFFIELGAGAV